jgi:hypothetical protein
MVVAIGQEFDHEYRRSLQMALNELTESKLAVDGVIGPKTVVVLKRYQLESQLLATGVYDARTQEVLEPFIERKYLRGSDYIAASELLGCKPAVLRAVVDVAGCGDGFFSNGRSILWFERHLFYQMVAVRKTQDELRRLAFKYPDVVNPTVGGYCSGEGEYQRFAKAASIDPDAAMRCTRWGLFQLLGSKHKVCGYDSVTSFITAMQYSERNQLSAFAKYTRANERLLKPLVKVDFKAFALEYFGPNYKENNYHVKLFRAMRKHEMRFAKALAKEAEE